MKEQDFLQAILEISTETDLGGSKGVCINFAKASFYRAQLIEIRRNSLEKG